MSKPITGAILLFLIIIIGAIGYKILQPQIKQIYLQSTSDAKNTKGKINVAADRWIGNLVLNSTELKKILRKSGYLLINEGNLNASAKMTGIEEGTIDVAAFSLPEFLLFAHRNDFPATIIAVIGESTGADAILADKTKINSIDALKRKKNTKIAFAENSRSHFFAFQAAAALGGQQWFRGAQNKIKVKNATRAASELEKGAVALSVLSEPDVSKSLADKNLITLYNPTKAIAGMLDVLVARRDFAQKKPDVVVKFLKFYFETQARITSNKDQLSQLINAELGPFDLSLPFVPKSYQWAGLKQNWRIWFGLPAGSRQAKEGVVDAIELAARWTQDAEWGVQEPIAGRDPYRMINRRFLRELYHSTPGQAPLPRPAIDEKPMKNLPPPVDPNPTPVRPNTDLRDILRDAAPKQPGASDQVKPDASDLKDFLSAD